MTDNSDPVFEANVTQGFYVDGEVTSIHEVRYDPEPHEPLWYTGDKLLPTGFYYWDEAWGNCFGPFEDEEECRESLAKYAKGL